MMNKLRNREGGVILYNDFVVSKQLHTDPWQLAMRPSNKS